MTTGDGSSPPKLVIAALLSRLEKERWHEGTDAKTAAKIGINKTTYSELKNGKEPTLDNLRRLCRYFKVPIETEPPTTFRP